MNTFLLDFSSYLQFNSKLFHKLQLKSFYIVQFSASWLIFLVMSGGWTVTGFLQTLSSCLARLACLGEVCLWAVRIFSLVAVKPCSSALSSTRSQPGLSCFPSFHVELSLLFFYHFSDSPLF